MFRFRSMSDERVVRRVLGGEREAYGVLVERYFGAVRAVGYAHTGNRTDADDVAQEAFLRAFQGLDNLRECAKFSPWLLTIARNIANSLAARRKREAEVRAEASPHEASVKPDMERRELFDSVRRQVMRLNEGHREVLMLYYFSGKSLREIAGLLGVTPNAAKKRLQRARKGLSAAILLELKRTEAPATRSKGRAERIMGLVVAMPVAWQPRSGALTGGVTTAAAASIPALKAGAALVAVLLALACGMFALGPRRQPAASAAWTPPVHVADVAMAEAVPGPPPIELGAGAAIPAEALEEQPSPGSISGIVVDLEGRPLVEARVLAYDREKAFKDAGGFEPANGSRP
jgi:RNA polymerase sigma-70 factor, ECF subfamily